MYLEACILAHVLKNSIAAALYVQTKWIERRSLFTTQILHHLFSTEILYVDVIKDCYKCSCRVYTYSGLHILRV